jgi:hypothetical protein
MFSRLKGSDCTSELIGLYDVSARLMSIALQHGASAFEKLGDLLSGPNLSPVDRFLITIVSSIVQVCRI